MRKLIGIFSLLLFFLTAHAAESVSFVPENLQIQLASFLSNPNIVYVLFLLAIYGIFFEVAHPGLILPGLTGALSLVLVLYAFQLIPVNYIGISLILTGVLLMITEIYISSFGIVGLGGIIAFIAGSFLLFNTSGSQYHLSFALIFVMSAISGTFIFIVATLAIKSQKRKVVSGREGLMGSEGVVENITDDQIMVLVLGEIWKAKSSGKLNIGEKIKVTNINGLVLMVEPLKKLEG